MKQRSIPVPSSLSVRNADIDDAIELFDGTVDSIDGGLYRGLLRAEVIDDEELERKLVGGWEGDRVGDGWYWLDNLKLYFHKRDGSPIVLRNTSFLRDILLDESLYLADEVATDEDWERKLRELILLAFLAAYLLGRGGVSVAEQRDANTVADLVLRQYVFLYRFASAVEEAEKSGKPMSEARRRQRARMYVNAGAEAHGVGTLNSFGYMRYQLPAYPGDGSSECGANDRCHWDIRRVDEENFTYILAYWILDPLAEHCNTCVQRSVDWNPYVIEIKR